MIKLSAAALVLLLIVSCGGNGPRRMRPAESYVVNSAVADPANNAVTFIITVDPPATEAEVKRAAEMLIAKHRAEYKSITVKSYLRSSDQSGPPYATSFFADDTITHSISPKVAPQKIPTH